MACEPDILVAWAAVTCNMMQVWCTTAGQMLCAGVCIWVSSCQPSPVLYWQHVPMVAQSLGALNFMNDVGEGCVSVAHFVPSLHTKLRLMQVAPTLGSCKAM